MIDNPAFLDFKCRLKGCLSNLAVLAILKVKIIEEIKDIYNSKSEKWGGRENMFHKRTLFTYLSAYGGEVQVLTDTVDFYRFLNFNFMQSPKDVSINKMFKENSGI